MERISSNDASSIDMMLKRLKERNNFGKTQNRQNNNGQSKGIGKKKINLTTYMTRLANARNPIEVNTVIQAVHFEANTVKRKGASNEEIAAARRAVLKVKEKGNLKIYRLRREDALKRLSEIYKTANKKTQADNALQQLKSKKRTRKSIERLDVLNTLKPNKNEDSFAYTQTQANSNPVNNEIPVSVDIAGMESGLTEGLTDTGGVDLLL